MIQICLWYKSPRRRMTGPESKAKPTVPRQLLASDWRMGKGAEPLRPVLAPNLRLTPSAGELKARGGLKAASSSQR